MLSCKVGICIYVIWLQNLSILPQGLCNAVLFLPDFSISHHHLVNFCTSLRSQHNHHIPGKLFMKLFPSHCYSFMVPQSCLSLKCFSQLQDTFIFQCSLRVACRLTFVSFACPVPNGCLAHGNHSVFLECEWKRIRWDFEMHWDLGVCQLSIHSPWNVLKKCVMLNLFLKLWGKNVSIACFVFQVISVVLPEGETVTALAITRKLIIWWTAGRLHEYSYTFQGIASSNPLWLEQNLRGSCELLVYCWEKVYVRFITQKWKF